jgi:hypothetical protein
MTEHLGRVIIVRCIIKEWFDWCAPLANDVLEPLDYCLEHSFLFFRDDFAGFLISGLVQQFRWLCPNVS